MSDNNILQDLNPAQRDAVIHRHGPMLVVAGAGSGKTRVLTHRIAHLIENDNINPFQILAITFTNKAAQEMKSRVHDLVDVDLSGITTVSYTHLTMPTNRRCRSRWSPNH